MTPGSPASPAVNQTLFRRLGYLLVFLMMAGGIMTLGNLIQSVAPGWHSGILAAVLLFIVADRLYVHRSLKSLTPLSSEWALAVGAQWIVISVLIRLLLSYANGPEALRTDLSLFARGYLAAVLTPELIFSLLLALLVWHLTGKYLSLLDEIGLDQTLAVQEEAVRIQGEVVPARQRLVSLVFGTGIVLVVLTALARLDLRAIVSGIEGTARLELNRLSGGEAGALLFFVFGLALLSLCRLLSLQTRWAQQRIPVFSQNLTRQWGVYSVFFLLFLAVIVSLLPAGDSIGLFSLLGALFRFLVGVLLFIGQLVLMLVTLLFTSILLLFGADSAFMSPSPPPLPALPPPEPAEPVTGSEVWTAVRSILLWGSLIVIVVFAFVQFLRQHGGMRAALRRTRIRDWLAMAWGWLYRNMDRTRGTLSRAIADGWQKVVSRWEKGRILPRIPLIHMKSLDPRRRVFFFYQAMIRRGAEQGLARKPSQTPSEYAARLGEALPSAEEEIESITDAFVQARYSRLDIDARRADAVKALWYRIRRALRDKAKNERPVKQ